ncbi:MAG TPA: electron transport complex subunit RsxB, partial [Halieaceae bacterium]|nr:electron transport complex subunit RsxB [Halieaceae bacterium]
MLDVIASNPILLALAALVGMAILFGALLGYAAVRF